MKNMSARKKRKDAQVDAGPFGLIFDSAMGRILDQSLILGRFEFTVSILAEATGLTYKTVKSCLERLQDLKWVKQTRKLGNAQAYMFDVEDRMSSLVSWATEFHAAEINAGIKQPQQTTLQEPKLRTEVELEKPKVQGLLNLIAESLEESLLGKTWLVSKKISPLQQETPISKELDSPHEKLKNILNNLMLTGKDQSEEVLQLEKRLDNVDNLVHSYRDYLDSVLHYAKPTKDTKTTTE